LGQIISIKLPFFKNYVHQSDDDMQYTIYTRKTKSLERILVNIAPPIKPRRQGEDRKEIYQGGNRKTYLLYGEDF
jgi:hypothetical protein